MTCGIATAGTAIQPARVPSGEMFGAFVAENSLIRGTCAADAQMRWEFWIPGLRSSITGRRPGRAGVDLTDLRRRFGDRFSIRNGEAPERAGQPGPYVFVTGVPEFALAAERRRQMGRHDMPLCALLHSAIFPQWIPNYLWLALSAEEGDVLAATTTAGRLALENLLGAAQERIRWSTGGAGPLTSPEIVTIPLAVDLPRSEALDQARARFLLEIPQQSFVVLYAGRISEDYKADLDCLIQGMLPLFRGNVNAHLMLAGQTMDQGYVQQLRNRLSLLGVADRTSLIENFPDVLKSAIYSACDVFVSPADSIQETFGLAVLEGMAHAKPVVASSWSGYRDLVADGATGILLKTLWRASDSSAAYRMAGTANPVEMAHYMAQRTTLDIPELTAALLRLAGDPAMARAMGERGRARVSDLFSWKVVAPRFLDLWASQVDRKRNRAQKTRPPTIDIDRIFSHFADGRISAQDFLTASRDSIDLAPVLANHWPFSDEAEFDSVQDLLESCRQSRRIEELLAEGYSWDCISWVVKKGLCSVNARPPG